MKSLVKGVGYAVLVTMIGVYLFLEITGARGIPKLLENRRMIETLQKENEELRLENQKRREKVERLEHDREEQELEVRKRWKLQREHSVDFYIPEGQRQER